MNVISDGVLRGSLAAAVASSFRRVCMPCPLGGDVVVDGECLGLVSAVDADEPWMPVVRRTSNGEIEEISLGLRHRDALRAEPGRAPRQPPDSTRRGR